VLLVGPDDPVESLIAMRDQLGLTMPVLYDEGGQVHKVYQVDSAFTDVVYPQEYLIDASGQIVYVSNTYEPDRLQELIDGLLVP